LPKIIEKISIANGRDAGSAIGISVNKDIGDRSLYQLANQRNKKRLRNGFQKPFFQLLPPEIKTTLSGGIG
jgi:hypothetical protein